jgi:DNA-binding beta-propeller fold protein YncE
VLARIKAGDTLYGIGIGFGSVWSASQFTDQVLRIDPRTNRVVARVPTAHEVPYTFAASPSGMWVTTDAGTTDRIDPTTNRVVARVPTGDGSAPGDPDTVAGRVWVPDGPSGAMSVIDPSTDTVVGHVHLGRGYSVAQRGFGAVWVVDYQGSEMTRVDPAKLPP